MLTWFSIILIPINRDKHWTLGFLDVSNKRGWYIDTLGARKEVVGEFEEVCHFYYLWLLEY